MLNKIVTILIVLSLAFAICIITILSLVYKERLTALITFLMSSIGDVVILRPLIIIGDSIMTYLTMKLHAVSGKVLAIQEEEDRH